MTLKHTLILVMTFFLPLYAVASSTEENEPLIACIDEYPPYQVLGTPPSGSHITALHKLAELFNKELRFIEAPNFARCVKQLALGQVDVIVGLNSNPERDKFAFYAPYKSEDNHVFIYRNNDIVANYSDIKGKIIGVPRGTTYFEKFDQDTSLRKISIPSVRIGIELLLKQRIDVIITSAFAADALLTDTTKEYLKTTTIKRKYYKRNISYFGFSKKNRLNLSEEKIVALTTAAFEQGVFKE